MNTVDALNVLGKALCGDSFEVKPGLTDAETILEIAKNYEGGGSGGGGKMIELTLSEQGGVYEGTIDPGLEPEYFVGAWVKLIDLVPEGGPYVDYAPINEVPYQDTDEYLLQINSSHGRDMYYISNSGRIYIANG